MICILKLSGGEPAGWIIANDVPEARRRAHSIGQMDLAEELYRMEFTPPTGKHTLQCGYILLADS
jgi:hypothetical protein